jgi:hypothetical protein
LHGSGSSDPFPKKTDIDIYRYKCLWIFDIKVIFLVVWKCNKIQKCILPCENFNFVTKISRYFAKFRNISRYEISRNKKNYFAKYEINISRNFVDHPTLIYSKQVSPAFSLIICCKLVLITVLASKLYVPRVMYCFKSKEIRQKNHKTINKHFPPPNWNYINFRNLY